VNDDKDDDASLHLPSMMEWMVIMIMMMRNQ